MVRTLLGAAGAVALLATTAPVLAQPVPHQSYPYKSGPVTITSCTLNEDKSNSTVSPNSLRINYYNTSDQPLTSITFRVRYASTPVTITDTGTFNPKQSVTHQFNQLGGLPWAGSAANICRVITATFADGKVVNPPYDGPDGEGSETPANGGQSDAAPGAMPQQPMPAPAPTGT